MAERQAIVLIDGGLSELPSGDTLYTGLTITIGSEITASRNISNSDLAGQLFYDVNSSSDIVLTVPDTLTGTEPVTIQKIGSGSVSFAEGANVTIQALDDNMFLAGLYASATLIPKGSNVYGLVGALSDGT